MTALVKCDQLGNQNELRLKKLIQSLYSVFIHKSITSIMGHQDRMKSKNGFSSKLRYLSKKNIDQKRAMVRGHPCKMKILCYRPITMTETFILSFLIKQQ